METATLLVLMLLASPAAAESELDPASAEVITIQTSMGLVYVSASVPDGHYGERHDGEAYWLPGVDDGTSLVRKVIRAAKARRATGKPAEVESHLVENRRVWVTDAAPFPGVFWMRVGDRHAWIAGVEKPLKADMAALEAAADRIDLPLDVAAAH